MNYEWYLAGVQDRVPIPGKYVSQLPPTEIEEIDDVEYQDQIYRDNILDIKRGFYGVL